MAFYPAMGGGESIPYIAPSYDDTVTYNKEDVVLHDNEVYMCNTDGVTGTWDSTKWTKKYLAELTEYNSNLGGKADLLWANNGSITFLGAQTISIDLTNYDAVIIESNHYGEDTIITSRSYIKKGETLSNGAKYINDTTSAIARKATVSNSGVTFDHGIDRNVSNDYSCIPQFIYGVKGDLLP